MQRIKDDGVDPTKPVFSRSPVASGSPQVIRVPHTEGLMTKPGIDRKITADELEAHSREAEPWFVVKGEVRASHITCESYLQVWRMHSLFRFTMAQVF